MSTNPIPRKPTENKLQSKSWGTEHRKVLQLKREEGAGCLKKGGPVLVTGLHDVQ